LDLPWPGKDGFNKASDHSWMVDGQEAGIARSYKGFTFLKVHNAGHMVPMNQPKNALAMLKQFLAGNAF
jgi:cathepsin A (carboxypeptidase C)